MLVYLVRHGEAKSEKEDPERGLTDMGKDGVRSVGGLLAEKGVEVCCIFHSPKKRARETAEILSDFVGTEGGIREVDGLKPSDDPEVWKERLIERGKDAMLVGHMPFMGTLASMLTGGRDVFFDTAGVMCLRYDAKGFKVEWSVSPS